MKINGAKDTIYLGYHYGDQIFVEDTFRIDPKKGYCTFSGKEPLKGGIYLAILMDKNAKGKTETKYFDFLVDNTGQSFMIETDTTDFVAKMKVTGSPLNEQFNKYQKFLAVQQPEMGKLKTEIDTLEKKPKEQRDSIRIKKLREKLSNKDKELNEYRLKTIKDDPKSMLSTIFSTMQEPETPKEQDRQRDAQRRSIEEYSNSIKKVVATGEVSGVKISKTDQDKILTAMFTPSEVVEYTNDAGKKEKTRVTKLQVLQAELQNDPAKQVAYALWLLNGSDFSFAKKQGKEEEQNTLRDLLNSRNTSKTGKTNTTSKSKYNKFISDLGGQV